MVVERAPDTAYVTDVPVLVAEILSPSTRGEDTVRKSTEYLAAGIGQYWLVDVEHRVIDVFQSVSGGWDLLARLDEANPDAVVRWRRTARSS